MPRLCTRSDLANCTRMKYILILFLNFPMQVFVQDVSNNPKLVLPTCPTFLSCKGRCSSKKNLENATRFAPHCHCDPHCEYYMDCCADYYQFCAYKNHSSLVVPDYSDKLACVMTEGNTKGVWMVAKCPKNSLSDDDTKRKCLDGSKSNRTLTYHTFSEDVPVLDILSGLHYRNKYCALCNGVDAFLLMEWKLRIRCNIKPPAGRSFIEQVNFLLKYCPTRYREIEDQIERRFCYNITSTCPVGGTVTHAQRTKCEQGPTQVVTKMQGQFPVKNFRNMDCLLCNGHESKNAACGPRDTHGNIFNPKSFEVLINTVDEELQFQQTCGRNFVYDKHLQICRLKFHKMDPVKAVSDKYRFKIWLTPPDEEQLKNFSKDMFVHAFTQVVNVMSSQIVIKDFGGEDKAMAVTFDVHSVGSKSTNGSDNTNSIISNKIEIQELLKPNATFCLTINRGNWTVLKLTWRQLSCVKMDTYLPGDYILFPWNNSMLINKTKEILPASAFYLKDGEDKFYDSRIAYVCRSTFTTFCPFHFVSIKQEDYTILANGSLYHFRTGTRFVSGEYYIEKGFGVVCTNNTDRFVSSQLTLKMEDNVALRYMTLIGLSVSVFSLLLVLLTHILLKELRSPLPGKNLMSLSLSLLLAHFLFLLGSGDTDKPTFCKVTAIALHWLFLVSFACMAVIAHDTRATFSRKMSNVQGVSIGHSHNPRFLINTALAWGLPLLFVAVCTLLEEINVFDIGYGGQVACWVAGDGKESQRNAQLVVFAAPVALVLMYNVFAFSQTIMAITVARQQTKRLNKTGHNNPNMVKIYIRLLSLMGFSWFFGFSAPYIHEALMYPFVFFSTLQGLYIFIAFVCKARIWRMYKVTFSRNSLKIPRSTTYITTDSGGMKSTKLEEVSIDDTNM